MLYTTFFHTHKLVVILFLAIYVIKTLLLLTSSTGVLEKFSRFIKIPEMVISLLFLATGVYLLINIAVYDFFVILKLLFVVASIPVAIIGFKKQKKLLAFISLLLIVGAYGLAEAHKARMGKLHDFKEEVITKPEASNYSLTLHGKALYNAQCAVCHGSNGIAGLSGAKNLQTSQLTSEAILEIVNSGKNTMPKMENKLNEQELKALVQYVKELRIK